MHAEQRGLFFSSLPLEQLTENAECCQAQEQCPLPPDRARIINVVIVVLKVGDCDLRESVGRRLARLPRLLELHGQGRKAWPTGKVAAACAMRRGVVAAAGGPPTAARVRPARGQARGEDAEPPNLALCTSSPWIAGGGGLPSCTCFLSCSQSCTSCLPRHTPLLVPTSPHPPPCSAPGSPHPAACVLPDVPGALPWPRPPSPVSSAHLPPPV